MAWWNILTPIVQTVGGIVQTHQQAKSDKSRRTDELKEAKHKAVVDRITRGDETERDYDMVAQENARNSIMDEIMIFWLLIMVTCLFIPYTAPYAVAGFEMLGTVPTWFQTVFVGAYISKLGLRFLFSGRTLFGQKLK